MMARPNAQSSSNISTAKVGGEAARISKFPRHACRCHLNDEPQPAGRSQSSSHTQLRHSQLPPLAAVAAAEPPAPEPASAAVVVAAAARLLRTLQTNPYPQSPPVSPTDPEQGSSPPGPSPHPVDIHSATLDPPR